MSDERRTALAIFSSPEELIAGVKTMLSAGKENLEVLSPVPLREIEELLPQRPGTVRWFTLLGCVGGGVFGMALQVLTVLHWPLLTGGKPALSWPAFVVICFEMAILFGAVATFVGFLLNAKLPPVAKEHYHPGCSQNEFALLVRHDDSQYASIESRLRASGAKEVRVLASDSLRTEQIQR